jgi:glucose dehydrogenase
MIKQVGKIFCSALFIAIALVVSSSSANAQTAKATDWQDWGGDAARTHFSPLQQITPANVS